jgi:hypothetical protein
VFLVTPSPARSSSETSPLQIVTGEVFQVEGEFHMTKTPHGEDMLNIVDKSYVITDQAGRKLRLMLNHNTKVLKRINPGDWIEAKISAEGQTLSITRVEH